MARGIHALNSHLAARLGTRQVEAVVQADAAAVGLDRAIGSLWQELLAVLRGPRDWATAYSSTLRILHRLTPTIQARLGKQLLRLADRGYSSSADVLASTLPLDYLRAAAPIPTMEGKHAPARLRDTCQLSLGGHDARRHLRHARKGVWLIEDDDDPGPEPAEPGRTSDQWRELFRQLLFPPPALEIVNRIVFGTSTAGQTWQARIQGLSRLAPAEVLANIVAGGMSQGLSQREIAKQLLPQVDNVRASARRVARTEGLRVMHAMQQQAHDQVDNIIAGYKMEATLDQNTRPTHRARHGSVWMKNSGENKQEALGLENGADFPPDAPNCRCALVPIMTPPAHIVNDPAKLAVFTTNAKKVVPDPQHWSEWFQKADDRRRRIAVGVRRLRAAEQIVGKDNLTYAHLVNEKGHLLSIKHLESESPEARAERVAKVQTLFQHRAELIRQTSTFGFLRPAA